MAATNKINILAILEGLGEMESFTDSFSTTTTITAKQRGYQTQAVADTAEAVKMGGVGTAELVIIKCISNDVDLDANFSSNFSADLTIQEGEIAIFKPYGTLYLKNSTASETSTIEYLILGTA